MSYPKCAKCGERSNHSHCRGCEAKAPKPGKGTVAEWEERTGWKYIEGRSDRLLCPTCQKDPAKVAATACFR